MTLLYDVVISGDLVEGFSREQVKSNLTTQMELTLRRSEQLLTQKQQVYARGLSYESAEDYIQKFYKAGLKAYSVRHIPEHKKTPSSQQKTASNSEKQEITHALDGVTKTIGETQQLKYKNFQFTGNGAEYFRIWVVNVVLTILTLGIYSAWAKVRNKQYFYGNTFLDDASFSYLAEPKQILKGRLIAFAFFVIYASLTTVFPGTEPLFGLVFFFAFPWLMVKSIAFNSHYSEYRNVRFGFDGKYGEAITAFVGWPLLGLLTLGILFPYAIFKQQRFLVTNHRYGDTNFSFEIDSRPYYRIFLMLIAISVLMGILASLVSAVFASQAGVIAAGIVTMMMYLLLFVYYNVTLTNLRFNHAALGGHHFEAAMEIPGYYGVVLTNTIATILTLGLFLPWAKVRIAQYKAEHISVLVQGELEVFSSDVEQRVGSFGEGMGDVFDLDLGF